jgi:hypothetical protein
MSVLCFFADLLDACIMGEFSDRRPGELRIGYNLGARSELVSMVFGCRPDELVQSMTTTR